MALTATGGIAVGATIESRSGFIDSPGSELVVIANNLDDLGTGYVLAFESVNPVVYGDTGPRYFCEFFTPDRDEALRAMARACHEKLFRAPGFIRHLKALPTEVLVLRRALQTALTALLECNRTDLPSVVEALGVIVPLAGTHPMPEVS